MPVVSPDPSGLQAAVDALRDGALVGMPTETVYGLAADATRPEAVARVFEAKARPTFDPLIVHLPDDDPLAALAEWVTPRAVAWARPLAEAFWPGPLTLVLPRRDCVLDLVTAGLDTVAVRVPRHPVAQALLRAAGPVVAPSANRFGRISPTRPEHVVEELADRVAVVLDGGPCEVGVESTVVGMGHPAVLYRPGGTPLAAIEALLGPLVAAADPGSAPRSPGQLASHYAPLTPVQLAAEPLDPDDDVQGAAVLRFRSTEPVRGASAQRTLSPEGDLAVAARALFATLRQLDDVAAPRILCELCPTDEGLGHAINDRLRRAAV
jgi:L-threonylcarbamoyladenylate synthase